LHGKEERKWRQSPALTKTPKKPYKTGGKKKRKAAQALENESTKVPKHKTYKSQCNHWKTTVTNWHP
jgi:hypothetical protein